MFNHIGLPENFPIAVDQTIGGIRHYTTPEGGVYPSVTTMLGQKEKPWLKKWQHMLGEDKAKKETQRCADRGSAIHSLAEKYLNNEENFTKGVPSEFVRGFNQLKVRLNRVNNIRAQEVPLFSDTLKIAGRVDCVGEYNDVLSIVDFKTSNNNKDRDMIFDYFLQTTAYAIMWHEMTGEAIEDLVIIMSVEKGMVPLVFQDKIDKYVKPLLIRVNEYHRTH